jgi:hypothetical protein
MMWNMKGDDPTSVVAAGDDVDGPARGDEPRRAGHRDAVEGPQQIIGKRIRLHGRGVACRPEELECHLKEINELSGRR